MALIKEITLENGTTPTYHRITSAKYDINEGKIYVNIAHYMDKMRDKEKEINEIEQNLIQTRIKLSDSNLNEDQLQAYSQKLQALNEKYQNNLIRGLYFVNDDEVILELKENSYNIKSLYEELKKLEIYSEAQEG